MTASNLLLTGGYFHPFDETGPALADLLGDVGIESELETDLDRGFERLAGSNGFELLTVYALRWRMLHPRFDDERDRWAYEVGDEHREAVRAHLAHGGGLLAVHTAAICFDDWPEWAAIVGGAWNWERSSHPLPRMLEIDVRTDAHPIVSGMGGFEVEDELYSFLDWEPDVEPLMTSPRRGEDQPLLAARERFGGRVVYDALGHDMRSLGHPAHQTILRRSALWALGRPDEEVAGTA